MHPLIHGKGTVLLVVSPSIDQDVKAAIQSQHRVIEGSPVNVLLRVDSIIDHLVASLEDGFLC